MHFCCLQTALTLCHLQWCLAEAVLPCSTSTAAVPDHYDLHWASSQKGGLPLAFVLFSACCRCLWLPLQQRGVCSRMVWRCITGAAVVHACSVYAPRSSSVSTSFEQTCVLLHPLLCRRPGVRASQQQRPAGGRRRGHGRQPGGGQRLGSLQPQAGAGRLLSFCHGLQRLGCCCCQCHPLPPPIAGKLRLWHVALLAEHCLAL